MPLSRSAPSVALRLATAQDVEFIVATERLPGYDRLVGRWEADEHRRALDRPDTRYLIGSVPGGAPEGFVILQPHGDLHEGSKVKRIAVRRPEAGFGTALLAEVVRWVFANSADERVWLDVFVHNARARNVYARVGFREDGLLRQAYRLPDGSLVDRVIMSVLRREWRGP
jgi:RimJ/RimL family protein N-acetyltransferase